MATTPSPHLLFRLPPATGGQLVFGAGDEQPPPALATGTLQASTPAPTASASGSAGSITHAALQASAANPAPTASGAAQYNSLTERPTVTAATAHHQAASALAAQVQSQHASAASLPAVVQARHQPASPAQYSTEVRQQNGAAITQATSAHHAQATASQTSAGLPHQDGTDTRQATSTRHADATPAQRGAAMPHQDGTPIWQARTTAHRQARQANTSRHHRHHPATPRRAHWHTRHQDGRTAPAGMPQWPQPPRPPVRVSSPHLLFACPAVLGGAAHLVFGRVCGAYPQPLPPIYILPARFYMAVHSLTAHLLPSNEQVPIYDVSLSADIGSTVWTFSASAPAGVFDALTPTDGLPRQIKITLDGLEWVFVVDSLQRQNQFGQRSTKLSGRSATALMGSPYSRETARLSDAPYTAQQLAEQALDLTGVALSWGIDDWLVPAGAWSHTGTPLAAVQAIAEAAGGYVNSHRSAATLLVRHPYPTLPGGIPGGPWNWGGAFAADVELAPDSIITSGIERKDGPAINGVYVSGTTQGVLAHIRRTGTAGANLAGMVTDPLITDVVAAQQRGLSVLGAAGAKHHVQITLPILTGASQPGVLDVGQLVQINESTPWRGRVRSVSVQGMAARQSVTLERHL